ncbi:MAG: DUF72 domain-containing protein [Rhodanobacter sp.]
MDDSVTDTTTGSTSVTTPSSSPRIPTVRVGCAGWSIPRGSADSFPEAGSHLHRYAQIFNAVEINSSFYRNHLPATYRRWADSVPEHFRFSVKFPRTITHQARLEDSGELLPDFLAGVAELGSRLGCLLLQLPPRLAWDASVATPFFKRLRRLHKGPVACEPRHASWFDSEAGRMLSMHHIARVAADPALSLRARVPEGDRQLQYLRLHGSPRIYYDTYADDTIRRVAVRLQQPADETTQRWCIFDNTAEGHATANALSLLAELRP